MLLGPFAGEADFFPHVFTAVARVAFFAGAAASLVLCRLACHDRRAAEDEDYLQ